MLKRLRNYPQTPVFALLAGAIVLSTWTWGLSTPSANVPLSAAEAMTRLQDGNARFVAGKCTHPRLDAARLAETAERGQNPFATVITCSDSRVPVEFVFDQGIGDLFVIRVAGNVCNVDEIGSAEYGVDHLGTPLLVVLGHTGCGAVTAVATGAALHGNIPPLVESIGPAVKKAAQANPHLCGSELVPEAIKANCWQAIENLLTTSPATRDRVKAGKLKIVAAIYNIRTGIVGWLGTHPEQERLLTATTGPLEGKSAGQGLAAAKSTAPNTSETRTTASDARTGHVTSAPASQAKSH